MRRTLPSVDTIVLFQAEIGWRPLNQEISGEEKRDARVPASLSECACVLCIRGGGFQGAHMVRLYFRHWRKPERKTDGSRIRQLSEMESKAERDTGWSSQGREQSKPAWPLHILLLPGDHPRGRSLKENTVHPKTAGSSLWINCE